MQQRMREPFLTCSRCDHPSHAKSPCDQQFTRLGVTTKCSCHGEWRQSDLMISGFCYDAETLGTRRLHDQCPGEDHPYPCECGCHSSLLKKIVS